jgi:hypothetical protein
MPTPQFTATFDQRRRFVRNNSSKSEVLLGKEILMFAKLILLLVVLLTACAPTASSTNSGNEGGNSTKVPLTNNTPIPTSTNSGIEGQVLIGPMCPVVQIGVECPDQPYQATITVNSLGGEKIVQFLTDENGRFHIALPSGKYILHPESTGKFSFAAEQTIAVLPGQFTQIIVTYDSGIR